MKIFLSAFLILLSAVPLRADPGEKDLEAYRAAMRALADRCRADGMELEAKVTESYARD